MIEVMVCKYTQGLYKISALWKWRRRPKEDTAIIDGKTCKLKKSYVPPLED